MCAVRTGAGAMTDHEVERIARRVAELVRSEEPWLSKEAAAEHFACSARSLELAVRDGLPYRTIFGSRSSGRPRSRRGWTSSVRMWDYRPKQTGRRCANSPPPDTGSEPHASQEA